MPGIDPDYVDVAERIREFYDRYPTGSLQALCDGVPMEIDGKWYVKYVAAAYRTPDDPRPGVGTAWEPVPGPTPFTKNSELQNAETSAWGRAIIAVGIPSKKIAAAQDVQKASPAVSGTATALSQPAADDAGAVAPAAGERTTAQAERIVELRGRLLRALGATEGEKRFKQLRQRLPLGVLTVGDADAFISDLQHAIIEAEAVPA